MSRASNGRGSVYRSKDTDGWEGLVSFGKDPASGRRLRKKVRGRTKTEVQAKVDELARLRRKVRGPVDFRITFSECLHNWVESQAAKVGSVQPSTIKGYRTDLKYVDESGVGAVRLVDLVEEDIEELYDWVVASGCGLGTVAHLKRTINPALAKAAKQGVLASNPVTDVELRGESKDMPEPYDSTRSTC